MEINYVKQIIEDRGMTIAEFARKTGFHTVMVSRWKSGVHKPSRGSMKIIREVFPR